jgi:hypothetical protein
MTGVEQANSILRVLEQNLNSKLHVFHTPFIFVSPFIVCICVNESSSLHMGSSFKLSFLIYAISNENVFRATSLTTLVSYSPSIFIVIKTEAPIVFVLLYSRSCNIFPSL